MSGDRIVILADRGDLAFIELDCGTCGSRTMGVVVGAGGEADRPVLDTALHPELDPATEARLAGSPPLALDDVVAMRRFLARWHGDVRSMLGQRDAGDPGPSR